MTSRHTARPSVSISVLPSSRAVVERCTGIQLLSADDFQTWFLSIEVLGDTIYKVRL